MKSQSPRRRLLVALLLVALVAILGAVAWQALRDRGSGGGHTAVVRRGTLKAAIETSGRLVARRSASVSSIASGQVKIVAVREGELARKGDVLIVLDDTPARADVQRAERAVEAAETRVGVAQQRAQGNDSALPDLAAAEADATTARAALATANDRLAATLILAPFDGVVSAVRVGEGSTYAAGSEAVTLADLSDLSVTADLDEVDRPLVSPNQEVTVTVSAFPATPLQGRIATISSSAQSRGGSTIYPVQISFDRPAGKPLDLVPGMTVDVRIITDARNDVLIIPSSAVRRAGERQYVTVRRDGRDVEVEVRTGARSGGDVEIADGLTEGDVVVLR